MTNLFGTDDMAAGYATSRPAVHPRVMRQVYDSLKWSEPVGRALDVGCGAGVSTRALEGFAGHCIGIEPAEPMLQWTTAIAPHADFAVGTAEAIPICDHSIDLITAAGSLNYADLDSFFPEAARVLLPLGVLVVYDFVPGRSFRKTARLDEWFAQFTSRYPPPDNEARTLSPEILANMDCGFQVQISQHFEIGIPLTRSFYVDYMMTETNVAAAVRGGAPQQEIRSWCTETLSSFWESGEREVLFRGYFVCMTRRR